MHFQLYFFQATTRAGDRQGPEFNGKVGLCAMQLQDAQRAQVTHLRLEAIPEVLKSQVAVESFRVHSPPSCMLPDFVLI